MFMAAKIRLSRMGAKKNSQYHIVAVDSAKKRDGAYLAKIGQYFPKAKNKAERLVVNQDLLTYWHKKVGAQMTDTVHNLMKPFLNAAK
jgi:small subunit ribosomal protein S16